MGLSADELLKFELVEMFEHVESSEFGLRVFTQSSNLDQDLFSAGGLTFGFEGIKYGSCDSVWTVNEPWVDPFNGATYELTPAIALEGTDCLNRKSSGNAQYQRFHHALGAVRAGGVGIYYLRPGSSPIRPELYGMAHFASQSEKGTYLVTQNLSDIRDLVESGFKSERWFEVLNRIASEQVWKFSKWFESEYGSDWGSFAERRSTLLYSEYAIKHAGRMKRNFTDSSQRAGHIAVGEMYLTKYFFGQDREVLYLFPRMTPIDLDELDNSKATDKEWSLLRREPGVRIVTLDDFQGVPDWIAREMTRLSDVPLKGVALKLYKKATDALVAMIRDDKSGLRLRS